MDLHKALEETFESDYDLSIWTLYAYLEELSITYKKIIYKNLNANCPRVKKERQDVSFSIFAAHLQSFDFIYIDEISFNLQLWPTKGWAPSGAYPKASRPGKSINYSVIAAMDINGILCFKIVKGGVKSSDFFIFIQDIVNSDRERFHRKPVVLFMDNASIHKSKDYMRKFSEFYNVMYNAPYTPQFNPIEFAFSKWKNIVRKFRPTTEKQLMKAIFRGSKEISDRNAANYIVHSLKYLKMGVAQEDFFLS